MKYKYEVGTPVVIFKHKMCIDGAVGIVKERDGMETSYLIKDITWKSREIWVREENLMRITFNKPQNILDKIRMIFY